MNISNLIRGIMDGEIGSPMDSKSDVQTYQPKMSISDQSDKKLSTASHKANLEYYNALAAKSLRQATQYLEAQTKIMQDRQTESKNGIR